ncbi:hypothetical protein KKF84_18920 [Myxococcota bacterium]|nr:hypothetical protein [Myxococcota bacterium]MBU1537396.1 hypothetical protein [Myxococcota bacterium]
MRFVLNKLATVTIFAIIFTSMAGCGPVEYMGQVGVKASKSHASLSQAHGEKYSPYEYWSSKYYLERARYKAGYGDYQDSVRYGKKAQQMSRDGSRRAIVEKKREVEIGQVEEEASKTEPPPEGAPVKLKVAPAKETPGKVELEITKKGEGK